MLCAFKCRTQEELTLLLVCLRIEITDVEANVYTAEQFDLSSLDAIWTETIRADLRLREAKFDDMRTNIISI